MTLNTDSKPIFEKVDPSTETQAREPSEGPFVASVSGVSIPERTNREESYFISSDTPAASKDESRPRLFEPSNYPSTKAMEPLGDDPIPSSATPGAQVTYSQKLEQEALKRPSKEEFIGKLRKEPVAGVGEARRLLSTGKFIAQRGHGMNQDPNTGYALAVQEQLISHGYLKGPADGKFGRNTEAAVKEFQKDNGLVADGKVGKNTWANLRLSRNEY